MNIAEIFLIIFITLIVFGPKRLPEIVNFFVKVSVMIKNSWMHVQDLMDKQMKELELKKNIEKAESVEKE